MDRLPDLNTSRTRIRLAQASDAECLLDYRMVNRNHLKPWEPAREPFYFTLAGCLQSIAMDRQAAQRDQAYSLLVFDAGETGVLGTVTFSNVTRGVFQACYLGYGIAAAWQGRGLMHEALEVSLEWVFRDLGLRRVIANYLPQNRRSERLLMRLGFQREGYARSYLCIDGTWRDHVLTSLMHPDIRN